MGKAREQQRMSRMAQEHTICTYSTYVQGALCRVVWFRAGVWPKAARVSPCGVFIYPYRAYSVRFLAIPAVFSMFHQELCVASVLFLSA